MWGPDCRRGGNAALELAPPPPVDLVDGAPSFPSIDGPGGTPFADGFFGEGDGRVGSEGSRGKGSRGKGKRTGRTEGVVEIYWDYPEPEDEVHPKKKSKSKSKSPKVEKAWTYVASELLSRPECRYMMCVLSTIGNTTRRVHLCQLVNALCGSSPPPPTSSPTNNLAIIAQIIREKQIGSHQHEFWRMVGYMQFALLVDW